MTIQIPKINEVSAEAEAGEEPESHMDLDNGIDSGALTDAYQSEASPLKVRTEIGDASTIREDSPEMEDMDDDIERGQNDDDEEEEEDE